jgi:hypothetical protein
MWTNVQFTGTLGPGASNRWFTWGWPAAWQLVRYMMSTSPQQGAPQVDWDVAVERADPNACTYWITVKNLTAQSVTFEARYAVLG